MGEYKVRSFTGIPTIVLSKAEWERLKTNTEAAIGELGELQIFSDGIYRGYCAMAGIFYCYLLKEAG